MSRGDLGWVQLNAIDLCPREIWEIPLGSSRQKKPGIGKFLRTANATLLVILCLFYIASSFKILTRFGLSSHKISSLSPTIRLSANPCGLIVSVENKDDRIQDFIQYIEEMLSSLVSKKMGVVCASMSWGIKQRQINSYFTKFMPTKRQQQRTKRHPISSSALISKPLVRNCPKLSLRLMSDKKYCSHCFSM